MPVAVFITAALPLQRLLDVSNFLFDIPLYQRPYQWTHVQTTQLLRDLHYGYKEQKQKPNCSYPVLLGNLVLLHQKSSDFRAAAESSTPLWWSNTVHFCDVIDGQQRLTTLCILYAALQHELLQHKGDLEKEKAKQLRKRFVTNRLLLQTANPKFGRWFGMDIEGLSKGLDGLLDDKRRSADGGTERTNARLILKWLKSADFGDEHLMGLQGFLDYLDQHVFLTMTLTAEMDLAFRTFTSLNYSGKALGNVDVMKALLVQHISRADKPKVALLLKSWKTVASDLESCQSDLIEDRNGTEAWQHPEGLAMPTIKREHDSSEATLFDELLEHMRHIADHDRLNKAEVLEYFMYFYPTDALPNTPGFNINKEAAQSFMKSLENHATAFRAMLGSGHGKYLTIHHDQGHRAADQWASGAVFNMMCLPQQLWRPSALLAIVRANLNAADSEGVKALKVFMRELECISIYMVAMRFRVPRMSDVYSRVVSQLKTCKDFAEDTLKTLFHSVWTSFPKAKGKIECLKVLNVVDLYREGATELANTVLPAVEHQQKAGQSNWPVKHLWDGKISVEHIMPQTPGEQTDWFKPVPAGPAWTPELHSQWEHKLGNLCLLTGPMNSSLSNNSFVAKQERMTANQEVTGTQPGNIAIELGHHKALWDEQAVKAQHLKLLRTLACRWDILEGWEASQCNSETSGRVQGLKPKMTKAKKGTYHFLLDPVGAKMDDVEPIKLLPNTHYTFGNEEGQGDNHITIASDAVVDAEHARIETGGGSQQITIVDLGTGLGTSIGNFHMNGKVFRPRQVKPSGTGGSKLSLEQVIVFGQDDQHAAFKLIRVDVNGEIDQGGADDMQDAACLHGSQGMQEAAGVSQANISESALSQSQGDLVGSDTKLSPPQAGNTAVHAQKVHIVGQVPSNAVVSAEEVTDGNRSTMQMSSAAAAKPQAKSNQGKKRQQTAKGRAGDADGQHSKVKAKHGVKTHAERSKVGQKGHQKVQPGAFRNSGIPKVDGLQPVAAQGKTADTQAVLLPANASDMDSQCQDTDAATEGALAVSRAHAEVQEQILKVKSALPAGSGNSQDEPQLTSGLKQLPVEVAGDGDADDVAAGSLKRLGGHGARESDDSDDDMMLPIKRRCILRKISDDN